MFHDMFVEPEHVLRPKAVFLEHPPDVLKQNGSSQKCSNLSWKPQEVLNILFGRPIGTPRRFATARVRGNAAGKIARRALAA
eukprot:9063267-Pyramimonas_sp.AAC.1